MALKQDASESALASVFQRAQTALGVGPSRFTYNMRKFKGFTLDTEEALLAPLLSFPEVRISNQSV